MLPFDLTGSDEQLAEAVRKADAAFGGAGVDYLVHNAGEGPGLSPATCCDASSAQNAGHRMQPVFQTAAPLPAGVTWL